MSVYCKYIVHLLGGGLAYEVHLTEQLNCTRAWISKLMSNVTNAESEVEEVSEAQGNVAAAPAHGEVLWSTLSELHELQRRGLIARSECDGVRARRLSLQHRHVARVGAEREVGRRRRSFCSNGLHAHATQALKVKDCDLQWPHIRPH